MLWNGRWMIQDLDSTNGTFLNGSRVTVPTPIDGQNKPDLRPLLGASEAVGGMVRGDKTPIIVFEPKMEAPARSKSGS